ncbi:phage replisome organizer N-terminal domain-containing protein [Clostridium sp. YIM B02551]|uniref:phage replisome organizer N-terminal domain-containing protein n=1 Tax=Clostridium sp. YIM B02551 TaxID=2910679 RepID=UPI001EEA76DE|nr:phage replisome organizer N-terminal domain-containing protein [Clostridium sp. YIM B02551]
MAEIKWIKITTNMFDDEKIKLVDAMPERDTIFYIWIRLLVQAGKTNANGYIFLNENVPYTDEMLSTIFNRPLNSVRLALDTLSHFGMIHVQADKLIQIANWSKHQNIEGMDKVREQNRLRQQRKRDKEQSNLSIVCPKEDMSRDSNVTVTEQNKNKKEELDKEEDKEITTTSSNSIKISNVQVFKHFEKCGFRLSPIQFEEIAADIEVYTANWVMDAAKEASDRGKLNYSYVKGILSNWSSKGRESKPKNTKDTFQPKEKSKLRFDNFEGRNYDYDDLEKKLLGWDTD